MKLRGLSWVLSLAFVIGACSVYQSDGRKFLQSNAMNYASYPFQLQAVCTEDQRIPKQVPWTMKWFDGHLALFQHRQDLQSWFMSWPPFPGGCLVQILAQGLSEDEKLTGLIEMGLAKATRTPRP